MTLAFRLRMARLRILFLTEAAGVVVIAPVVVVVVVVGIVVVVVMVVVAVAAVAVAPVSPVTTPVTTAVTATMTTAVAATVAATVAKSDVLARLNAGGQSDHRAAQQGKKTPSLHHRLSSVGSTRRTGQEPG